MWSIGGMVLTGEMSVEHWWYGTDRGDECVALVDWY